MSDLKISGHKIKVGVIGGRSVVAGELLRLLVSHRYVEVTYVESSSKPGALVNDEHPFLQGRLSIAFSSLDVDYILENCDVLFVSRPHMHSAEVIDQFPEGKVKIIDMGADFRLDDLALYPIWYKTVRSHSEKEFVYGLSEINHENIAKSTYVANPGCYPTSVILGCYPLMAMDGISEIIVDSYSGVSGAGKTPSPKNHFLNVYGNVIPYRMGEHPHTAEMEQMLKCKVLFFPHVIPLERGIISTIFVMLPDKKLPQDRIVDLYKDFYKNKPFVEIVEGYPEIKNVCCTNFCNIGINLDSRTGWLAVTSVIDNIMKGASGQAVQNMNIMEGFSESEGL